MTWNKNEYMKEYTKRNKEKILQKQREYRIKNREKINMRKKINRERKKQEMLNKIPKIEYSNWQKECLVREYAWSIYAKSNGCVSFSENYLDNLKNKLIVNNLWEKAQTKMKNLMREDCDKF